MAGNLLTNGLIQSPPGFFRVKFQIFRLEESRKNKKSGFFLLGLNKAWLEVHLEDILLD
jgi:hypothetical protein